MNPLMKKTLRELQDIVDDLERYLIEGDLDMAASYALSLTEGAPKLLKLIESAA